MVIDSNVMIWALDPIFSEEKENDETVDRLLSILKGHSNVVTTCRWSPDGKYKLPIILISFRLIASASDDETVRVWRKTEKEPEEEKKPAAENEEDEEEGVIQYECIHVFKGHRSGRDWIEI